MQQVNLTTAIYYDAGMYLHTEAVAYIGCAGENEDRLSSGECSANADQS